MKAISNLKQLHALRALDRCGTFANAALELGLTAPAVHNQLKSLEDSLQTQLIIRDGNGPNALTDAGRILVATTDRIIAELERSLCDIDALKRGLKGHVRLGVVSTGKYFAPALVARLAISHPDIEITLDIGNRRQIVDQLDTGQLHLAIMGRPPSTPPVRSIVIGPHPYILIASPAHPLAGSSEIKSPELQNETIIAREEGSGTRMLMTQFLEQVGPGHQFETREMDSNETIKQAVIAGLGIAVISKHTVVEELKSGRLVSLNFDGMPIHRNWFIIQPANVSLSACTKQISDAIALMKGSFLPG